MTRCARISTLLVFFSLATQLNASQAARGDACRPADGRLVSQVVPIGYPLSDGSLCAAAPGLFCTTGRFTGGLAGRFDFTATTFDPSANPDFAVARGAGFFAGRLVAVCRTAQSLIFKDAGAIPRRHGDVLTFARRSHDHRGNWRSHRSDGTNP